MQPIIAALLTTLFLTLCVCISQPTQSFADVLSAHAAQTTVSANSELAYQGVPVLKSQYTPPTSSLTATMQLAPVQGGEVTSVERLYIPLVQLSGNSSPPPNATTTIPPATTPTISPCPQATPEPLWIDPVTSSTSQLTQTITVYLGNGEEVTIETESGTFRQTGSTRFALTIDLLPDTIHHLRVTGKVRQANQGGCVYGGYTLSATTDRQGNPLMIVQQSAAGPTKTPTQTQATTTVTASPTHTPTKTQATATKTSAPTQTPTPETVTGKVCLSPAESELARLINDYRANQGLDRVPVSKSLTQVGQAHAADLYHYAPDKGTDSRGLVCNMHSWSDAGNWTPVCYTSDHKYAEKMWSKPHEITGGIYTGNGFEIAYWSSGQATASAALHAWKGSSAHNDVILEKGIWAPPNWQAMGIGIVENYAVVWFGEQADSQGTVTACP